MATYSTPSAGVQHSRNISESFAAFDTILSQEVTRLAALSEENAHLRELLCDREVVAPASVAPSAVDVSTLDAAKLAAELAEARRAQEAMARELAAFKAQREAVVAVDAEDHSSEVSTLKSSLATLAEELQAERERIAEVEQKRKDEEDKVATLRLKVEESRRALMRLQGESASRRSSSSDCLLVSPIASTSRRTSFNNPNDTAPLRKSALGLVPPTTSSSLTSSLSGLGFACESPVSSTFSFGGHRRGSASIAITPEAKDETERIARLRDLRLGVTSTTIRRPSATGTSNGSPTDFDFAPPRRRLSSISKAPSFGSRASISEEDDDSRDSLQAPQTSLRLQGRKQSVAVFDAVNRRGSWDLSAPSPDSAVSPRTSAFPLRTLSASSASSAPNATAELKAQLDKLKLQLAESEEGRQASEQCLKSLKEYITASPSVDNNLRLPPLPTESGDHVPAATTPTSRWGLRLPSLGGLSPAISSPNLSFSRRGSVASTFSNATATDPATPSTVSTGLFASFSFSDIAPPSRNIEASPRLGSHRSSFESDRASESSSAPSLTFDSSDAGSSQASSPTSSPDLAGKDDIGVFDRSFGCGAEGLGVVASGKDGVATTPVFTFGIVN